MPDVTLHAPTEPVSLVLCRQVRTTVALMLSFIVEKADEMILPAGLPLTGFPLLP